MTEFWHDWYTGLSEIGLYFMRRSAGLEAKMEWPGRRFTDLNAPSNVDMNLVPKDSTDARFSDKSWHENLFYDFIKEMYLFWSKSAMHSVLSAPSEDVDHRTRVRAEFWIAQIVDALSPSNFFLTNPEAINKALDTRGQSLLKGLQCFVEDMQNKDIRMTDKNAFEVGKTLACTPGKVVYRTDLFELIQYAPQTQKVHAVPLLIVPPWINKFYVMDMRPQNSMIRWLVDQGFTVFLISWRNIGKELADTTFSDYLTQGIDVAVSVVKEISCSETVHPVGYCIGGTALSTYMAWCNNHPDYKKEPPVNGWTLFTSLVDFANPGEIETMIGEDIYEYLCEKMDAAGFMDGEQMNWTFRMLRPNMLIWSFWVKNYLLGEDPEAWDTLFWNSDPTRLPVAMHKFYLSEFYLKNNLVKKEAIAIEGVKIDLAKITQPLYNVGTESDHIVLWQEAYKIARYVRAPVRQVLATSGHILGIISPPVDPPKRAYWAGESNGFDQPQEWLENQTRVKGSWWEDWAKWLRPNCGDQVSPPKMGGKRYKPLCDAPGEYVKEK
jgi:polyhydroxyalkanoate synthase